MMYLRYMVWQTELFVILLGHFLPYPPKEAIQSKFWKNEKSAWRYYHFKLVYHKWRWWYGSWRYWERENFFSFWAIFCAFAFTPLTTWKINQNFENMKKMPVKISSFCTSICVSYDERFLRYGAWQMSFLNFLSFLWTIFCPFQFYPQQPRKSKF